MKLIQQKLLFFKDEKSDKVYEVDLCHVSNDDYIVNFRYGRRGGNLKEGTKTVFPVSLFKAQEVFDKLVDSKVKKGYQTTLAAGKAPAAHPKTSDSNSSSAATILTYLEAATKEQYDASTWALSRVIWRAGALKIEKALPFLKTLALSLEQNLHYAYARDSRYFVADKESEMGYYAAIWSLARIGGQAAAKALRTLDIQRLPLAENIYRAALVHLKDELAIKKEQEKLQAAILALGQQESFEKLEDQINHQVHVAKAANLEAIFSLYVLSWEDEALRSSALNVIQNLPLKPNAWKQLRSIFKVAEMLEDVEVLGLIANKIEQGNSFFTIPMWYDKVYVAGGWIPYKDELKSKKSRLAFSNRTRQYFIRRVLRLLAQSGTEGEAFFCKMATAILLQYSDEDYKKQEPYVEWLWDATNGYTQLIKEYHPLTHLTYLTHLLFANSTRLDENSTGKILYKNSQEESETREEAFPQLWDQYPQYLVQLLEKAKNKDVLWFAVKAVRERSDKGDLIGLETVINLFRKSYPFAVDLGLEIAQAKYNPEEPNIPLIIALLQSNHQEALHVALQWMNWNIAFYAKDVDLVTQILMLEEEPFQNWIMQHVRSENFSETQQKEIIFQVINSLMEAGAKVPSTLVDALEKTFPDTLKYLSLEQVQSLLEQDQEILRSLGIKAFSQMPLDVLKTKKDLIEALCLSPHANLRQMIGPVIKRIITEEASFAQNLFDRFLSLLLKEESQEGMHEDLYQLIMDHFELKLKTVQDKTMLFVDAPYAVANKIGAYLLEHYGNFNDWDLDQVVALGNREMLHFRKLCFDYYNKEKDRIRYEREVALTLLDSDWEDSRKFAFEFFEKAYSSSDWTPELLIAVCDNIRKDVQAFGRKMLVKHFQEKDGPLYLQRLSQHPDTALQLYTTNYLENYATGNLERIQELEHYFKVVLTQVNKGKTAKERLYKFLEEQAVLGPDYAEFIASILNEVVLTISVIDKAKCILILNSIRKKYPHINNSIQTLTYELK